MMSLSASILFIDIETVSQHPTRDALSDERKNLWQKKTEKMLKYDDVCDNAADAYAQRAGIFAEFGKIICISVWYMRQDGESSQSITKSFAWDDEKVILSDFFTMLDAHYSQSHHRLCGHNIIEFDIPYLCRRGVVHGLRLPSILHVQGKKPREIQHLDTLEMWKFGDRKNYTSLDLLCHVMGVPTPKSDISWEQVSHVYREDRDLDRIVRYCERDVEAVMQLYRRLAL